MILFGWKKTVRIGTDGGHADPLLISSNVSRSFKEHKSGWQRLSSSIHMTQSWTSPPRGWFKCNFDAILKENKMIHVAAVRDGERSILKVWAQED